jgi:hypothetical protein
MRKTRPESAPATVATIIASGAIRGRNHAERRPRSIRNEQAIQKALRTLCEGRTTIVIAQLVDGGASR